MKVKNNSINNFNIAAFLFISLSLLFISCGEKKQPVSFSDDGSELTVRTGTVERKAFVNLPQSIKIRHMERVDYSLVFVLHGADSSANEIREISEFDNYSDSYNFIFVYPEGLGARWDSTTDNEFFEKMIEALKNRYHITRICFTGFSAGAVKVFELSKVFEDSITAVAPVCGLLKKSDSDDEVPLVNILHIYSEDDKEVPPEGNEIEGYYSVSREIELMKKKCGDRDFDIETYSYKTQGHVWNKKNADLITSFFYNHPKQEAGIVLSIKNDSVICPADKAFTVGCKVENIDVCESLEVFSNKDSVYKLIVEDGKQYPPEIEFNLIPKTEGIFYLRAELKLKSGKTIYSSMNPYYLSLKMREGMENETVKPVDIVSVKDTGCESYELTAQNCIDRNLSTRWSSVWADNQELTFDLGKEKEFSKMILFWETASAREYEIYCSDDLENWKKIYDKRDCLGGIEITDLESSKARYVKIKLIKRSTQYGFSLWECFIVR